MKNFLYGKLILICFLLTSNVNAKERFVKSNPEDIKGHACYTYGDNESFSQAEHATKILAIRNAIESFSIFIESTSQINDFQLTSDMVNSISAGQVKDIKVLKKRVKYHSSH